PGRSVRPSRLAAGTSAAHSGHGDNASGPFADVLSLARAAAAPVAGARHGSTAWKYAPVRAAARYSAPDASASIPADDALSARRGNPPAAPLFSVRQRTAATDCAPASRRWSVRGNGRPP